MYAKKLNSFLTSHVGKEHYLNEIAALAKLHPHLCEVGDAEEYEIDANAVIGNWLKQYVDEVDIELVDEIRSDFDYTLNYLYG